MRRRAGGNGDAALLHAHLGPVAALPEEPTPTAKRSARRRGRRPQRAVPQGQRLRSGRAGRPRRPGGGHPETGGLTGRRPPSR